MKQVARAVAALVVGFAIGAMALQVSARSADPPGTDLGELDFRAYCERVYGERAEAVSMRTDAYGWRCAARPNGLFITYEIVTDDACETLFGDPAYADLADPRGVYGWRCYRGPRHD